MNGHEYWSEDGVNEDGWTEDEDEAAELLGGHRVLVSLRNVNSGICGPGYWCIGVARPRT